MTALCQPDDGAAAPLLRAAPRAARRAPVAGAALLALGACALWASRPGARLVGPLAAARLAVGAPLFDDYDNNGPGGDDDFVYPEDDEVDDFNVVFEYDDELSITCSDVGYAIDGPHACVNITFDNRTCILTADCLDDANSTYYTNTCDLKCCEVDESYRLPGNWTVYDNTDGVLTCRSDLLECAINVLPEAVSYTHLTLPTILLV